MTLPDDLSKPRKLTAQERKAEREAREPNPFKIAFAKKEKHPAKRNRKPLQRRTPLGVGKGTLKLKKPSLRLVGKRKGQKFQVSTAGAAWTSRKRKPLRMFSLSESAKERRRLDAEWSQRIHSIWETCIITGTAPGGYWPVDPHHCYDKSVKGEWRHQDWNGLLLRRDIHDMVDNDPDLHKACMAVADECRAAAEGRKPPVTRAEARELIFRMAPKIRKFARVEEE